MRKALYVIIFCSLFLFSNCQAEDTSIPVLQIEIDNGVNIFCISTDELPKNHVYGTPHTQYIDDRERVNHVLSSTLSSNDQKSFLQEYLETGYAETIVYSPSLESILNCELGSWIADRNLGNVWILAHYSLVEHEQMYASVGISQYTIRYEDDILCRTYEGKTQLPIQANVMRLRMSDLDRLENEFGINVFIYEMDEGAIAFIIDRDAPPNQLMTVYIDGQEVDQIVGTLQSNGDVIFVCPLDHSDVVSLNLGGTIEIIPILE